MGGRTITVAITIGLAMPSASATAQEAQVGSKDTLFGHQAELVTGLRVGSTARRAVFDQGQVTVLKRESRRCVVVATFAAALTDGRRPSVRRVRTLRSRVLRLRGTRRREVRLRNTRYDFPGVDPSVLTIVRGRLPRDVAPAERRRTLEVAVHARAEEEGCLRAVRRAAQRVLATAYVRVVPQAPALPASAPSPTSRIDARPHSRIGGPLDGGQLGADIEAPGDITGDGVADLLFQPGAEGGLGRGAVVQAGGGSGLLDAQALGANGFSIARLGDDDAFGSVFTAGNFDGRGPGDIAVAAAGSRGRDGRGRPAQELVAGVLPGGGYRGRITAGERGGYRLRITADRGCSPLSTRVDAVGDVNGDGIDDLAVARSDGCGPSVAAIVFGGSSGTVSLNRLGTTGLMLDAERLPGGFAAAGDVNGDGFDDVALIGDVDVEEGDDRIVLLLGRPAAGSLPLTRGPGVVTLRRRGCGDLSDVAPAGDLDGDGTDELVLGIGECDDRELNPAVAHILRGRRDLRGTVRLSGATGTTIRARFGPLGGAAVAGGRDVAGGPGPDLALGFRGAGPSSEGETWLIPDIDLGTDLTLGSLGSRGRRVLGPAYGEAFGSDVAMSADVSGDGRDDLLIGAAEADFADRSEAGTVYGYAPIGLRAPACGRRTTRAGRAPGTDSGDLLVGTGGRDRLVGYLGDDCLFGSGGADHLIGDPGDDRLDGGLGPDRLSGGAGRDRLVGGPGADQLAGGRRGDVFVGGGGNDRIDARVLGGDRVLAGPGSDLVRSSDGAPDRVDCGPGRDRAVADPGDRLHRCEWVVRRRIEPYDD